MRHRTPHYCISGRRTPLSVCCVTTRRTVPPPPPPVPPPVSPPPGASPDCQAMIAAAGLGRM